MGLTLGVGWLSEQALELDAEEFADVKLQYEALNEVLTESGLPKHEEPLDLIPDQIWSADMWGYGGLHAVRRLAAYQEILSALPPPVSYERFSTDELTGELNSRLDAWYRRKHSGWRRVFNRKTFKPKYQHLLWHSDAEGFYIPVDFADLILDQSTPQREGLGGFVGSSIRLLDECQHLARFISLPDDMDEEDDELLDAAENPGATGWQRFGVEAFGLIRLMVGCKRSIATNGALIFG